MPDETAKRLSPAYPLSLAFLCLALTVYAELEYVYMLGFPDGFVTEVGAAEEKLAHLFEGMSLAMGMWFIYLGIAAFSEPVAKHVMYSFIFYALVIGAVLAIDTYFQANLMGGGGG